MRPIDADSIPWLVEGVGDIPVITKEEIDKMPTVDDVPVPVRHGKWIIRDNPGTGWYRVTCSECGEDVTSTAPCIGFFPNAKVTWDFCPNCGARMDEE
jgi:rRNA maturation protein Nop10